MVGHRFNRTFTEWSRWCVYFGGVQKANLCSGKQRAQAAFIWKELGLFFQPGMLEQATKGTVCLVVACAGAGLGVWPWASTEPRGGIL